jgi:hypothetical protein
VESKYLEAELPLEVIDNFKTRGYVMDYAGAIRFLLRKEIQNYSPQHI